MPDNSTADTAAQTVFFGLPDAELGTMVKSAFGELTRLAYQADMSLVTAAAFHLIDVAHSLGATKSHIDISAGCNGVEIGDWRVSIERLDAARPAAGVKVLVEKDEHDQLKRETAARLESVVEGELPAFYEDLAKLGMEVAETNEHHNLLTLAALATEVTRTAQLLLRDALSTRALLAELKAEQSTSAAPTESEDTPMPDNSTPDAPGVSFMDMPDAELGAVIKRGLTGLETDAETIQQMPVIVAIYYLVDAAQKLNGDMDMKISEKARVAGEPPLHYQIIVRRLTTTAAKPRKRARKDA